MSTVAVVGAQWGDEGKGKITDALAQQADVVVRYSGGNNAGHTVVVGEDRFQLHLVPSGILYPDTLCVMGNGLVIDPQSLLEELDGLEARGISTSGLRISDRAHLVLPYHRIQDELEEAARGDGKIGTTGRGIGPAYTDKVARIGLRTADLVDVDTFRRRLTDVLDQKNRLLRGVYGHPGFTVDEIMGVVEPTLPRLRPMITDTGALLSEAVDEGKRMLFEGGQGTLLDVDHGTYPYVTSSAPTVGGVVSGVGLGPRAIRQVIGVTKAYTTRVGEGPFPTELAGDLADRIREQGGEFGVTTGRPRRCGWFDAVMVRYAVRVNGLDGLAITKADVLTGLSELKVCVAYKYKGKVLDQFPADLDVLKGCEPVYETLEGWEEALHGVRTYEALPAAAQRYLERLSDLVGAPISIVSVGPRRDETVTLRPPFGK